MQRYPRAQRAVVAVLTETRLKAGLSARALALLMKVPHNFIARIESLEKDVTAAEFVAIAKALKVRPSTLMAKVEKR